jgi:hypothetical protein
MLIALTAQVSVLVKNTGFYNTIIIHFQDFGSAPYFVIRFSTVHSTFKYADHKNVFFLNISPPTSAKVKKTWIYTSTPPYIRFEVFMAVTMKNGVFGDVTPCGSCKNQRFGGT